MNLSINSIDPARVAGNVGAPGAAPVRQAAPAPAVPAPSASGGKATRLAELSDSQILDMIARAKSDPFVANEVMHLQKQAFDCISKAIQGMIGTLGELLPAAQQMENRQVSVIALASAAREREAASRQKREFAENLIIGALLNRNNPNWNIFDDTPLPADAKSRNGILALLQMPPPTAPSRPDPRGGESGA